MRAALVLLIASLGLGLIGLIDYSTGVELRVYPLYYAPISFVAWHLRRPAVLAAAVLSGALWVLSNAQAGLAFSHIGIWIGNFLVQTGSFSLIGLLIASLRESLARERGLSRTDPLTSLLNTRAFYDEATRVLALCRRHRRPVTMAYLDLDDFKRVNDSLGHQAGDDLLHRVAAAVRGSIRVTDLAARLGGDEFGVLLPETGPAEATATLERLRAAVAAGGVPGTPVSVSIGAVSFLQAPADFETLVHEADACMYKAKSAGKNQLRLDVIEGGVR